MPDTMKLELRYTPPYDWPAMRRFLRARAIAGVEVVADEYYARTFEIDGIDGTIIVEPQAEGGLAATTQWSRRPALTQVTGRLRRLFDLDADPLRIGAHLATDPLLAPLVAACPGLRVPGSWDGFELAVRAVLGQQITVRAARGLAGSLVLDYGRQLSMGRDGIDGLTHVFPRADAVATADVSRLGLPRARATTLKAVAAFFADQDSTSRWEEERDTLSRLREIRGIGQWTADYIAMRGLRDPDAFPAGDVGLQRALAGGARRRPTPREVLARAESWRPWRAYAAQHLWTSLSAAAGAA